MGAPEYRYTDRDVRENESLTDLAYDYLRNYGGDFEPLVNALTSFKHDGYLPTNMVRIVLNCMRNDLNVANDLPAPVGYKVPRKIATVVKPRRRDWDEPLPCSIKESHDAHTYKLDDEFTRCLGIPWEINRSYFELEATVKVPFARARGGRYIHMLTGRAWCEWHPPWHEYGWGKVPPILIVEVVCKYPSFIKRPILLTENKARVLLEGLSDSLSICPHCTEVTHASRCQEVALSGEGEEREVFEGRDMLDPPCQGSKVS